ncbi:hypothetical protein D3C86_1496370 [compost metagenome]
MLVEVKGFKSPHLSGSRLDGGVREHDMGVSLRIAMAGGSVNGLGVEQVAGRHLLYASATSLPSDGEVLFDIGHGAIDSTIMGLIQPLIAADQDGEAHAFGGREG